MALARNKVSQCAFPVGIVNADGYVMIWASCRRNDKLISGKRSYRVDIHVSCTFLSSWEFP
jgi:hypothetical protein